MKTAIMQGECLWSLCTCIVLMMVLATTTTMAAMLGEGLYVHVRYARCRPTWPRQQGGAGVALGRVCVWVGVGGVTGLTSSSPGLTDSEARSGQEDGGGGGRGERGGGRGVPAGLTAAGCKASCPRICTCLSLVLVGMHHAGWALRGKGQNLSGEGGGPCAPPGLQRCGGWSSHPHGT